MADLGIRQILLLMQLPRWPKRKVEKADKGDYSIITATVIDTHELRFWLLSQGSNAEVLAPATVRNWFVEVVEKMAATYQIK